MRKLLFYISAGCLLFSGCPVSLSAQVREEGERLVMQAEPEEDGAPEVDRVPDGYTGLSRKEIRKVRTKALSAAEAEALRQADPSRTPAFRWAQEPFAIFVNYGLYSSAAGNWQGHQVNGPSERLAAQVFMDDYEELLESFQPSDFDPERIVKLARKAGNRPILFTAKHKDGFCLFNTSTTGFNAVEAPLCKRDLVAEMAAACHRGGLPFGLYYALTDWHCPQAAPASSHDADPVTPEHFGQIKQQLTELLTHYGLIRELWLDGGALLPAQSSELYTLVKTLQPKCMVGGLDHGRGDFVALPSSAWPSLVPSGLWQYAEPMHEGSWGYRDWEVPEAQEQKINARLKTLREVIAAGGNYCIGLPLTAFGGVSLYDAQVISKLGDAARRWSLAGTGVQAKQSEEGQVLTKGMVLEAGNAVRHYGLDEADEYLACRSSLAQTWTIRDFGIRNINLQFSAEEIGSFVELSIDGKTYEVELLPEQVDTLAGKAEFKHQQIAVLAERHNTLPVDLPSWTKEKHPYFRSLTPAENAGGEPCRMRVRPMSALLLERAVYADRKMLCPVQLISGDAVEVWVNGNLLVRHLNLPAEMNARAVRNGDRRTLEYRETVLLPLENGLNKVLVKSYSRHGGWMNVGVLPAEQLQSYRMDFKIPDYISGFRHEVTVRRIGEERPSADACLHNLRLVVR